MCKTLQFHSVHNFIAEYKCLNIVACKRLQNIFSSFCSVKIEVSSRTLQTKNKHINKIHLNKNNNEHN